MREKLLTAAVTFVLIGGVAHAGPIVPGDKSGVAVTQQTATAQVNVKIGDKSDTFDFGVNLGNGTVQATGTSASLGVGALAFDIAGQTDPQIVWNASFINNTNAPLTFVLDYTQPLIGGPYGSIRSNYGVTLTDGNLPPGDGAWLNNMEVKTDINGVFTVAALEGPSQDCTAGILNSFTCDHDTGVLNITPVSGPGNFSLHIKGTLTGPDVAGFTGRADLFATPEPGSLFLLGTGLIALGWWRKRQK